MHRATLAVLLLPTCTEQPERSVSSVAFFVSCSRSFLLSRRMLAVAAIFLLLVATVIVVVACITNDKARADGK